jgi:hypothetical protein
MSRIVCLDCGHVHECETKKSALPPTTPYVTGPFTTTPYVVNPATTTTNPTQYTVTADTTEYNEKRDGITKITNSIDLTE